MINNDKTIAALSTPPGTGGIAIVRLTGKHAFEIAKKCTKRFPAKLIPAKMTLLNFINPEDSSLIDRGYLVIFKAPKSYTGENMVEFHTHGSPYITSVLLNALIYSGAYPAGPGEFTKRAFLNGKLDLTMAESVIELINAETKKEHQIALSQLSGALGHAISELRNQLIDIIAQIELNLDFSDQEIPVYSNEHFIKKLDKFLKRSAQIQNSYETGKLIRNGLRIVIAGKPNVGKSSLFNNILGRSRALVTDIPGTTRDYIEEKIEFMGMPVILSDTAGIRESDDPIENMGVNTALKLLEEAQIILFIVDATTGINNEDIEILSKIKNSNMIPIINKIDSGSIDNINAIRKRFNNCIGISVKQGDNLPKLLQLIQNKVKTIVNQGTTDIIITSPRHYQKIKSAHSHVAEAMKELKNNVYSDLAVIRLYDAMNSLSSVIGEDVPSDVLNQIFKQFCIGK